MNPTETTKTQNGSNSTAHLNRVGAEVSADPAYVLIGGHRIPKRKKFNWRDDAGTLGHFLMLPKEILNVDPSYQRPESHTKILKIASTFWWPAFGVLMVNQRVDGTYWIFDGQHRGEAAKQRDDVTMVPCIVYRLGGQQEESKAFHDINVMRNALRYIEKFNALLIHNDPTAHQINGLLAEHNYQITRCRKVGRFISCLSLLNRFFREDENLLRRIFPIAVDAARGGYILDSFIQAFWYIEKNGNVSLTEPKWRDRVKRHTPDEYEQAIVKAKAAFASGGAKRWAEGVVDLLNKNVRGPKLELVSKARTQE